MMPKGLSIYKYWVEGYLNVLLNQYWVQRKPRRWDQGLNLPLAESYLAEMKSNSFQVLVKSRTFLLCIDKSSLLGLRHFIGSRSRMPPMTSFRSNRTSEQIIAAFKTLKTWTSYLGEMIRKRLAVLDHMSIAIVHSKGDCKIRHVSRDLDRKIQNFSFNLFGKVRPQSCPAFISPIFWVLVFSDRLFACSEPIHFRSPRWLSSRPHKMSLLT